MKSNLPPANSARVKSTVPVRDFDRAAVNTAPTLPFHNGGTEGVNTKTEPTKHQVYGRANLALLRHRILLGRHRVSRPAGPPRTLLRVER